jgi:uncharacterized protein YjbK
MEQEIELEFKNLLTTNEFQNLLRAFSVNKSHFASQTNHYFDTYDFQLKSISCALRIREKNGNVTLTLKQPHSEGLLETHEPLSLELFKKMLDGDTTVVQNTPMASVFQEIQINTDELRYLGSLTTNRAQLIYQSGLLVFDHSFYLDKEDYEMEYEVNDATVGKQNFEALLQQYDIPLRETLNKIQRFFDASQNLEGRKNER